MNTPESTKVVKGAGSKRPPNAGKGRVKGVPNRMTKALKEMILGALSDAGGQQWLLKQADENPAAFMTLIGKVLPLTLAGDPSAPLGGMSEADIDAKLAKLLAEHGQ